MRLYVVVALHSGWCVRGLLVRIVSKGHACGCHGRGGHYCVVFVDIKNISGGYEGVDKGSCGRGRGTRGVVED